VSPMPEPAQLSDQSRIEAFSDGVFSIAITLLILEIRPPAAHEADSLIRALLHLWPSYLAFLTSFLTIGVMWVNHHRLFTLIDRADDALVAINLLLLLGVTWIPFPTALLAEHLGGSGQSVAAAVYSASFLLISLVYQILVRYALRSGDLTAPKGVHLRAIARQYRLGPLFYAALLLIGLTSATACLTLSAVLAIYFAMPPHLWRREKTVTTRQ
jgi:uncharacterized membrane protein